MSTAVTKRKMVPAKAKRRPGRGRVFQSITETIGDTPIVRLNRLPHMHNVKATILAKLEFFNPAASVKDRIGVAMVEAMEAVGVAGPETVLIEPTSGNTGIALAFLAAARGYHLILVMPDSMSIERRKMLTLLGADIVLTPAAPMPPPASRRAHLSDHFLSGPRHRARGQSVCAHGAWQHLYPHHESDERRAGKAGRDAGKWRCRARARKGGTTAQSPGLIRLTANIMSRSCNGRGRRTIANR